jgi:hypothetical protein
MVFLKTSPSILLTKYVLHLLVVGARVVVIAGKSSRKIE